MNIGGINLPEGVGISFKKLKIYSVEGNSRLQAQVQVFTQPEIANKSNIEANGFIYRKIFSCQRAGFVINIVKIKIVSVKA